VPEPQQIAGGSIDFRGLSERAIHVWPVRLDTTEHVVDVFAQTLSADETSRADRFAFSYLRNRYVLARGALRILLGQYLNVRADQIRFDYGEKGKPRVAAADVQFNVSHSDSIALLGFTKQCEIGIDVEILRPIPDFQEIARRFFCAEEATELRSLPADEREEAFLLCWTRKEAYLKAVGDGLSMPLDGFRVSLRRGEPARFIHFGDGSGQSAAWTLHDLSFPTHYAAALAYNEAPRQVYTRPLIEPAQLAELLVESSF
jgi:4'-phosphopantetheinyl transferase